MIAIPTDRYRHHLELPLIANESRYDPKMYRHSIARYAYTGALSVDNL